MLPAERRRAALGAAAGWLAPRADPQPPARSDGLSVAGELGQSTGMGQAARTMLAAAEFLGLARGGVNLHVGKIPVGTAPAGAALLLAVNAPSLPLMLARAPAALLRHRRVIGIWAWELPVVPPNWALGARYVHEAWVSSPFTAAALEPMFPGKIRVVPFPLALLNTPAPTAARAAFGLPEAAVVTVMVFALGSSFTRKNPLAGVAAFKRAFGGRKDQVLVVKFSGAAAFPREAARIMAEAAPNIRFFGESWPPGQVSALLACADIVLSLHRSEGFGLVPAEAMLLGKPVVATGWSGNMAYMDGSSAALVGFHLVKVVDPTGVYARLPGALWAEPDAGHAAELLRQLGDDEAARRTLGEAGRAHAAKALNGDEMRQGLKENGIE
jgi:glycosyltransferase involved in cell wall biosynthesis